MIYSASLKLSTRATIAVTAFALLLAAGCKSAPKVVDDATLSNNVRSALSGDATISKQSIQSSVAGGVVTLTGNVSDDTARLVAAEDVAKVAGVKTVINDLTIQGIAIAPTITMPEAPAAPRVATKQERQAIATHQPLPLPPPPSTQYPTQSASQPAPVERTPPPPPAPVYHNLNVPPGTGISVRITQTLDSETTQEGASFTGVVTNTVVVDGESAIPAGTGVSGRVVAVHEAGHYSGHSVLSIELTGLNRRGERFQISSEPYTVEGKGRGKNTAEKVGGGAAVGAILGGIFGGGKGAAIGAAAGGGGGAVYNGVTRGQQVQINSESIVRFRLANGFTIRSMGHAEEEEERYPSPGLQQRPRE